MSFIVFIKQIVSETSEPKRVKSETIPIRHVVNTLRLEGLQLYYYFSQIMELWSALVILDKALKSIF